MRPTIAILGASSERRKFGNKAVRAYASQGYEVFPVHPSARAIEGLRAYSSIEEIPVATLDRVSVYLPREVCLSVLPELRQKLVGEVWFNPGADDPEVIAKARALGLNVVTGCSIVDIGVSPSDFPD